MNVPVPVRFVPRTGYRTRPCRLHFKRPCASRRDTPHERARARARRAPQPRHVPCPHISRAGWGARSYTGRFFVSGRGRRRVVGGVFGSSTEEPNGGRDRGGKLKFPALGVCFYVPSVTCPGPIRLCPTQNDQKGVRATTGKLGIFLIWVFCRRPQFSRLII